MLPVDCRGRASLSLGLNHRLTWWGVYSTLSYLARDMRLACRKSWALEKEESTFIDWQRAKVQETTDEVSNLT